MSRTTTIARSLMILGWLLLFGGGCQEEVNSPLAPDPIDFGLVDESAGRFNWPVSRSGFAITRPPIYSSLVGLKDEPLDELDQREPALSEGLAPDQWRTFLRAVGTNPLSPFEMKPIRLEVDQLTVASKKSTFAFSADGDSLFIADGTQIQAWRLANRWKQTASAMEPDLGKNTSRSKAEQVWSVDLPSGVTSNAIKLLVTATGIAVDNQFDWGGGIDPEDFMKKSDDTDAEPSTEQTAIQESDLEPSSAMLVVVADQSTIWIDPTTGAVNATYPNPAENLESVVVAVDTHDLVATDTSGQVYWTTLGADVWQPVDAQVTPASQYDGGQNIAMNSDATAFIAMQDKHPITVWLSNGRASRTAKLKSSFNRLPVSVAWPDNGRNWCDDEKFWWGSPLPDVGAPMSLNQLTKIIWRPVMIWPQRSGRFSPNSGMTVLGLRRLQDGRAMWSVWDQNSNKGGNSLATELFDDRDLPISTYEKVRPTVAVSIDASRVAFLDPSAESPTIRVIYRNPWERIDNNQIQTWYRRRLLGSDEDHKQIDQAMASIRALPDGLYWARPPEELCTKYVHSPLVEIVSNWQYGIEYYPAYLKRCERVRQAGASPDDPQAIQVLQAKLRSEHRDLATWEQDRYDQLIETTQQQIKEYRSWYQPFERWLAQGGTAAKLIEAKCLMKSAWRARGSGMGYQVTQQGGKTFRDQCLECKSLCLEILKQPHPPMVAFAELFDSFKGTDDTHQSVEPYVRRAVRLYPDCSTLHHILGFWLLPRWGGQTGDTSSYIEAALSNVESDRREILFGLTQIRMADSFRGNVNYFSAMGVDAQRTFRGSRKLLKKEAMANPHWLGPMMWVATYSNNPAAMDAAKAYYREHFPYPVGSVYNDYPQIFSGCYADRPAPR